MPIVLTSDRNGTLGVEEYAEAQSGQSRNADSKQHDSLIGRDVEIGSEPFREAADRVGIVRDAAFEARARFVAQEGDVETRCRQVLHERDARGERPMGQAAQHDDQALVPARRFGIAIKSDMGRYAKALVGLRSTLLEKLGYASFGECLSSRS